MTLWWFLFIVDVSSAALAETSSILKFLPAKGDLPAYAGLLESDDDLRLNRFVLHWDV